MLSKERYKLILELLNEKKSITVNELVKTLKFSESTVRRDLNALDKMNKLQKVHGGAVVLEKYFYTEEYGVKIKGKINMNEKKRIAKYAAELIKDGDFVFIDAGTTTEAMIEFIKAKRVKFVTNGINHGKKLATLGYDVYLLGGTLKVNTEAIVGSFAVESLRKYNFTKGFFGTNAISEDSGFSTPDFEEAIVKEEALKRCIKSYILADSSKFNKKSSIIFGDLSQGEIITNQDVAQYKRYTKIIEVK